MQKRTRRATARCAAGNDKGDEDECPVCMVAYGRGERTERSRAVFPCGHAVCAACDDKLRARRFFACPTCRTPREGFSREEVDRAAQARTLDDAALDGTGIAGWEVQIQAGDAATFEDFLRARAQQPQQQQRPQASGSGGGWRVMFFANESNGDPFDVLRRVANDAVLPTRASRRRRVRHSERDRPEEEGVVMDEEEEGTTTSDDARVSPLLPDGLRDLIANHLLRPTSLHAFLARHREVTRPN